MKTLNFLSQKSRLRLSLEYRNDRCSCRSFILSMVLMTSFLSNKSLAQIHQNYSISVEKPATNEPIFHVEDIDISGLIETTPPQECNGSINYGLPNATIDIIREGGGAGYSQNTLTNVYGRYAFRVAPAYKYIIVPNKPSAINCGVTTMDINIIRNHIHGLNTLTTHQQLIAADMNQNDVVSNTDIILIRQIVLGLPPTGGPYPAWDFVAYTSYPVFNTAPSPTGTLHIPTMDNIIEQVFSSDAPNQDFVAIKMGDVDGSCMECGTEEFTGSSTDVLTPASEHEVIDTPVTGLARASDKVALRVVVEDIAPEKGMEWLLPVRISDIEGASVIAAGLRIDPTVLSILEVVPGELNESSADDFNATRIEEGELRFLWVDLDTKGALSAKDVLFYLRLRANEPLTSIAPFIKLDPVVFESVVHKGLESIHPLVLQVTSAIHGHSAIPNPFGTNGTLLHFYMPASDIVNISLLDATGRLIEQNTALMEQGHRQWQVGTDLTLEQGIYYYVITGTNVRYSGKILKF